MLYDAFICHACEDKEEFVRPLAKYLRDIHIDVWYDEFSLEIGDSLRECIDKGLASSNYGIVILSPDFFKKRWPQRELNGLVSRELIGNKKVILPIWHNIKAEDILKYSPPLADRKAIKTSMGLEYICGELQKIIRPHESPFIVAQRELIKYELDPPPITDEWWLDVTEASNRMMPWGFSVPDNVNWGRWAFPLPYPEERGKHRGIRLAWTAMQMEWTQKADELRITQITKPELVLNFISSFPALKDICHEYPALLAEWAPQLTIEGFGGDFEDYFEEMLKKNSEYTYLRSKKLISKISGSIACRFVQGDLGGPTPKFYSVFEYFIWLLSNESKWLPENIRHFLIDDMISWGIWFNDFSEHGLFPYFTEKLYSTKSINTFKLSPKFIESLNENIEAALKVLEINQSSEYIYEQFKNFEIFKKHFLEKQKKKR